MITKEVTKIIAKRVPPGDRWVLASHLDNIINGLVPTLEKYVLINDYNGEFRLNPLGGTLSVIIEEEIEEPEAKPLNLYGELIP